MTQEQKDLLLKDLCARLPYEVKVHAKYIDTITDVEVEKVGVLSMVDNDTIIAFTCDDTNCYNYVTIHEVKPYLFPLSSMTEEQWKELRNLIYEDFTLDEEFNEGLCYKTYGDILVWLDEKPINECYFIFDYFNKNHFDYRGLIEKSLALDATNLGIYE